MEKKEPKLFLNCGALRVDRGDHHDEYQRGDELKDVPIGTLETMIRLGQAIREDEFEADTFESEDSGNEEGSGWKDTLVSELGLPETIVSALTDESITTVAGILEYGSDNETLTEINGIGQASEQAIQDAIQKIIE